MKRIRKWIFSLLGITIGITAGMMWIFYPYRSVLSFQLMPEKEMAAYLPLSENDHFQLKFTHSVHLSDVYEEYKVEDERLIPVQLIYEDTAIGMPSDAGEGESFEMRDGKYYITNLQGAHESISLSVGQVRAKHTIIYNGHSYLLKKYVGAGSWVSMKAQYISNWELMRGVKLDE